MTCCINEHSLLAQCIKNISFSDASDTQREREQQTQRETQQDTQHQKHQQYKQEKTTQNQPNQQNRQQETKPNQQNHRTEARQETERKLIKMENIEMEEMKDGSEGGGEGGGRSAGVKEGQVKVYTLQRGVWTAPSIETYLAYNLSGEEREVNTFTACYWIRQGYDLSLSIYLFTFLSVCLSTYLFSSIHFLTHGTNHHRHSLPAKRYYAIFFTFSRYYTSLSFTHSSLIYSYSVLSSFIFFFVSSPFYKLHFTCPFSFTSPYSIIYSSSFIFFINFPFCKIHSFTSSSV